MDVQSVWQQRYGSSGTGTDRSCMLLPYICLQAEWDASRRRLYGMLEEQLLKEVAAAEEGGATPAAGATTSAQGPRGDPSVAAGAGAGDFGSMEEVADQVDRVVTSIAAGLAAQLGVDAQALHRHGAAAAGEEAAGVGKQLRRVVLHALLLAARVGAAPGCLSLRLAAPGERVWEDDGGGPEAWGSGGHMEVVELLREQGGSGTSAGGGGWSGGRATVLWVAAPGVVKECPGTGSSCRLDAIGPGKKGSDGSRLVSVTPVRVVALCVQEHR